MSLGMETVHTVNPLFPVPVCVVTSDRGLTNAEQEFLNKVRSNIRNNVGNTTSSDTYILNNPELKDLKEYLESQVKKFCYEELMYLPAVTPYITQSWLNYTETKQFHHEHTHPNSIISGVFYISASDSDAIEFYKGGTEEFVIAVNTYNTYNSRKWTFPVRTNDLILFPSNLSHSVAMQDREDTRISLAFNTFVKGFLGNTNSLNELIL